MSAFLDRWLALADRLSVYAVRIAGLMILASAMLISYDVLVRKFLLITVGGADELAGYAFAVGTSWAFAFTLLRRANVRVDALYSRLPSRACAFLDLLGLVCLLVFVGYLAWRAALVLQDSILFSTRATTPLATPLWIPQSLWVAGFSLFLFAIVPLIFIVAQALVTGDDARVSRLAGARTNEEDAAEEKEQAARLTTLKTIRER
ncbi:TRAP transporter small permease subunit [Salinarimonas soli]|uniref:TRAP transporter small permease protein n=1 Tax=Salinarimonas soli TaxID=1638099 RepID=A0A5B2V950_9HYPH|nr:TRAP transporter small permease [Salinarimonas soli]KAA2235531.1 TRAP transporter small permease subunit [Salinarimonas soli]